MEKPASDIDLARLFAPAWDRYGDIAWDFVRSSSFPLFLAYWLMISQIGRWKRNTQPMELRGVKLEIVYSRVAKSFET